MPRFNNEIYLKANPRVERKETPKKRESSLNNPREAVEESTSLNNVEVEEIVEVQEEEENGNE